MGRFRNIVAAAALAFAVSGGTAAAAQELEPVAAPEDSIAFEDAEALQVEDSANILASMGTEADPAIGQPLGGMAIQPQVTSLGERASDFNTLLLIIMTVVTIFVFALLIWAVVRFRRKANPIPSKTTHNVAIEVLWTVVPVLILVGIAVPSFGLLLDQYDPPEADVTIKATGHQWYWSYEYPDEGGFAFDSIMLTNEEAEAANEPKLLATDNRVVVPVGATVKVLVTAADVLHSWAMPAFWVKMDAVPGKINETWFRPEQTGIFYGQCSELCGTKHGFMPIAVEVVEQAQYDQWVAARQADAGIDPADLIEEETAAAGPVAAEDGDDLGVDTAAANAGGEMDDLAEADAGLPAGAVVEGADAETGAAATE